MIDLSKICSWWMPAVLAAFLLQTDGIWGVRLSQANNPDTALERVASDSAILIQERIAAKPLGKRVLLWACAEPKGQISQMGDLFLRRFRIALHSRLGEDWEVIPRSELKPTPELSDLIPKDLRHDDDVMHIARELPAPFYVNGSCKPQKHEIEVQLRVSVASGEVLGTVRGKIPRNAEWDAAAKNAMGVVFAWSRPITTVQLTERSNRVYRAGRGGVGSPVCIVCPGIHGSGGTLGADVALVDLTVDAGGRPKEVRILWGRAPNLNEQVVATVGKWQFRPALAPDGKPVATKITVTVKVQQ